MGGTMASRTNAERQRRWRESRKEPLKLITKQKVELEKYHSFMRQAGVKKLWDDFCAKWDEWQKEAEWKRAGWREKYHRQRKAKEGKPRARVDVGEDNCCICET
jgi:hypothetical protein